MGILIEIWNHVFPAEQRGTLTKYDLKKLNAELLTIVKREEGQYYISVRTGDTKRLYDPVVYKRLAENLPAVTVIYFEDSEGESALIVDGEVDLVTGIREFLAIPDSLSSRP